MNLDMHDAEWLALALHIGSGREAPDGGMTLSMEYRQGSNLRWQNINNAGRHQTLWCDSLELTEWLAEDYPVGLFTEYDPCLYPLLTTLALAPGENFFYQAHFAAGELTTSQLTPRWGPVITLHRNGRHLSLCLQDWSLTLLRQLTSHWEPWVSPAESLNVPFALSVGHRTLTVEQCLALQAGDGIVLQSISAIAENRLWLYLQEKRIEMTVGEHEIQVTRMLDNETPVNIPGMLQDINQLPIKVIAEVAITRLPLKELSNIAPGMVFSSQAYVSNEVRLTVNGACIGHGSLIALNDVLVVRVDSLINSRISRPAPLAGNNAERAESEEGDSNGLVG